MSVKAEAVFKQVESDPAQLKAFMLSQLHDPNFYNLCRKMNLENFFLKFSEKL